SRQSRQCKRPLVRRRLTQRSSSCGRPSEGAPLQMPHPAEARIRAPSDADVYAAIKQAFDGATDEHIVPDLVRMIEFVAVSYKDVTEGTQAASAVLERRVFLDCDELAGYFPWPEE